MDNAERLKAAAREVAEIRARVAADADLRRWCVAVKQWQSQRLAMTHADLLNEPRYRDAARFFLDDLYGAKDFSRRDVELARVIPTLSKMLPDAALAALADAVELDALSESLDEAVARALRPDDARTIDEADYAAAYRVASPRSVREHQLDLVVAIGRSLDRLVRHPLLGSLLSAMAAPARIAGVATMHSFLVRGFRAFKDIGGASEFISRIDRRERVVLAQVYTGSGRGWTQVPPA